MLIISQQSLPQNVTASIRPPMIIHYPYLPPSNPIVLRQERVSPACFLPPGGVIRHTLLLEPIHEGVHVGCLICY